MSSFGQLIANHSTATRRKYGRCPAVERLWDPDQLVTRTVKRRGIDDYVITSRGAIVEKPAVPLPGHEKDVIESLPDFTKISDVEKVMTPLNREDYRRRVRKILSRKVRLYGYSRDLRNRVNSTRAVNYIGSE